MKTLIDDADLQRSLRQLADKDVRQTTAWALNDTAADVFKHVQDRMVQVFDRPTRFTKNAFMVWRAKHATLEAEVMDRPSEPRRVCRRLQLLSRMEHHEQDREQGFP